MSRGDSQSNPTSDYDFGDLAEANEDDIQEEEELNMMKSEIQRLDMNLMLILNRFPLSDQMIGNFGKYNITYNQLKSLSRTDLVKLGIEDNKLQDEMLEEFANLEGQESTLKEVLDEPTEKESNNATTIVDTLQQHIYRLNTLLSAVSFQVGASSSSSSGVIINQRFCSTQVVLHLLGQLATHTEQMEEIVKTMADPERFEQTTEDYMKKKREERKRNCIVLFSTFGFFVAGWYIAKRLGIRKVF